MYKYVVHKNTDAVDGNIGVLWVEIKIHEI